MIISNMFRAVRTLSVVSLFLATFILSVTFFNSSDTADAASCGGNCFLGYAYPVTNHGVEENVSVPTSFTFGTGGTAFLLANAQGGGNPYPFIQIGYVIQSSPGYCTPYSWGIVTEHNVGGDSNYYQAHYCPSISVGSTHTLAVQYDGTYGTWDYTYDGIIERRVYKGTENLNFDTLASISFYGETTDSAIPLGGPNKSNPVKSSRIGYKAGTTGPFTRPYVTSPNPYAGNNPPYTGCGVTPCPSSFYSGNDSSNPYWYVLLWKN